MVKKTTEHRDLNGWESLTSALILPYGLRPEQRARLQGGTLQSEQARLLYSNQPSSLLISCVLALLLISAEATVAPRGVMIAWAGVFALVVLGRALLLWFWRRHARMNDPGDLDYWLRWFRIGTITMALLWGAGGVLLTLSGDIEHIVYASFILAGLCAGAATTLAIDRISVNGFLIAVLAPQILFLISRQSMGALSVSAMDLFFLIFLLVSARLARSQLQENFRMRQRATESGLRLRQILESSPIATRIADAASNQVLFANNCYVSLIESTPETVIGVKTSDYYARPEEYADVVEELGRGHAVTNREVELRSPGKHLWRKWVLASYFPMEYQGKPAFLGWFYDITDRKMMEDRVEHMAYHDALTGLPNRALFYERLHRAVMDADREQGALALMFVDLDRFKPVNDQYGHDIGDLLLKAVAGRIRGCLRKADSAARVGGDEFTILLPSVQQEKNALGIAEKIRCALELPFEIKGLTLEISSSTGIALYPDHADGEQQLINRADAAMYSAKTGGRNCVTVYRPGMEEEG